MIFPLFTWLNYLLLLRYVIYIYIKVCQSLSDDLLVQLLNLNQFEFLEHFEIEQCHNITGDAIETILSLKKTPKQLKMLSCRNITRRNFENIKNFVKQKGIKMNVEWIPNLV